MSVLTENYDKVSGLIKKLYLCTKKDEIERVFSEYDIAEKKDRITLLDRCIQVEETFSSSKKIDIDDDYDFHIEIFLEGSWRLLANVL